jgi:predicted RNase H-like HicB family nuclease
MKSFEFPVAIEPHENASRAYVPELESRGTATWGYTKEEALKNIKEVARIMIEELPKDGEPLPPAEPPLTDRSLRLLYECRPFALPDST